MLQKPKAREGQRDIRKHPPTWPSVIRRDKNIEHRVDTNFKGDFRICTHSSLNVI